MHYGARSMTEKKFMLLLIVILIADLATAIEINTESSYVGRIVGINTQDLIAQLTPEPLNPKALHVRNTDQLGKQNCNFLANSISSSGSCTTDDTDSEDPVIDLDTQIQKLNNNDLFVFNLEPYGSRNQVIKYSDPQSNKLYSLIDLAALANTLTPKQPILLVNAQNSGLYLPKTDSMVPSLGLNSILIAPISLADQRFVKSFICNFNPGRTVGDSFMSARNSYYENSKTSGAGLVLQSYELYGNPLRLLDFRYIDENAISRVCGKEFMYTVNYDSSPTIQSYSPEEEILIPITVEYGVNIDYNGVIPSGSYSLIDVTGSYLKKADFELALPYIPWKLEFPFRTNIMAISEPYLGDGISLFIHNLPAFQDLNLVNRTCSANKQNASVNSNVLFTSDAVILNTEIFPVGVEDCENGKIRLFNKIFFNITYVPNSPVLIKDIKTRENYLPNVESVIEINLQKMILAQSQGTINVYADDLLVGAKNVSINSETNLFNVTFRTLPIDGTQKLKIEYVFNNKTTARKSLDIQVATIQKELVSICDKNNIDFKIALNNFLPRKLNTTINAFVFQGESIIKNKTYSITIGPGKQVFYGTFGDLIQTDKYYNVLVELVSDGVSYSLSDVCRLNSPPVIKSINNIELLKGQVVEIILNVSDPDFDTVFVSSNNSNVRVLNDSVLYIDSNNFATDKIETVLLNASDGVSESFFTFNVTVYSNSPPLPVFIGSGNYTVGDNITIVINGFDSDSNYLDFELSKNNFKEISCNINNTCKYGVCAFNESGDSGYCTIQNGRVYMWETKNEEPGEYSYDVNLSDEYNTNSSSIKIRLAPAPKCVENKVCGSWTSCNESQGRQRICLDKNFCNPSTLMRYESQTCGNDFQITVFSDNTVQKTLTSSGVFYLRIPKYVTILNSSITLKGDVRLR